jgi:protein ImuA
MGGAPPKSLYKEALNKQTLATASDDALNGLLEKTGLWRASSINADHIQHCSTGFTSLDKELPGTGWPADGVTEFLHDRAGIGELRLLAPALARMTHEQNRWVLFVSPPYIPYPPALAQAGIDLTRVIVSQPRAPKDYLWVLEKALASQSCSAVIAWPSRIHEKQIRRLQLASKDGYSWGILFRSEESSKNASPAELRLRLRPLPGNSLGKDNSSIAVKILKRRGRWESEEFTIAFNDQLLRPMPNFSEMVVDQSIPTTQEKQLFGSPSKPVIQALHEYQ